MFFFMFPVYLFIIVLSSHAISLVFFEWYRFYNYSNNPMHEEKLSVILRLVLLQC